MVIKPRSPVKRKGASSRKRKPKIQATRRKSQVRAIPLRKNRRYFDKIYKRFEIYDAAKIEGPEGTLGIYEVMQRLAAKHGGDGWSENAFSKLWHFRHERVLIDGEKRSRVLQSFLLDEPDYPYEEDWRMRCQADTSERTVAMREAASVFKKARNELLEGLKPSGPLRLIAEAYAKRFSASDFHKDVFRNYWCRIVETGTLPPAALKEAEKFDSDAEGSVIYLYITESSLAGQVRMATKAKGRAVIDDTLRDWLVLHIGSLFKKLNGEMPQIKGVPAFPFTFLKTLDFAKELTIIGGYFPDTGDDPFHPNTFRKQVWNNSTEELPRNERWKLSPEKKKVLSDLFAEYLRLLALDKQQAPSMILSALFQDKKVQKMLDPYRR
ncbi:MAG: hypothetical protein AB7I36_17970 [Rhodospirillaceae bacterium]